MLPYRCIATGAIAFTLSVVTLPSFTAAQFPRFLTQWGTLGNGDGQFNGPRGVFAYAGVVHVADTGNHRIQVFTSDGAYITQWGTFGAAPGQFNRPCGVAFSDNKVYVADTNNHRIQVFTSDGTYITQWGGFGTAAGQFNTPSAVAVRQWPYVYVADTYNHRIQVFTKDGTYVREWGTFGTGEDHFNAPRCVDVSDDNGVLMADTYNASICIYRYQGPDWVGFRVGTFGTGGGQFNYPQFNNPFGVAIDNVGGIYYVADTGNHRIQCLRGESVLNTWGTFGAEAGQFNTPCGVAVEYERNIYVADTGNNRIQKFGTATPVSPTSWGDLKGAYR